MRPTNPISQRFKSTRRALRDAIDAAVVGLYYRPRYRWTVPILHIAGLPKSGTTWLQQLLCELPGYRFRWPADPHGCIANHDLCDEVFRQLPSGGYTVIKLHTRATPENLRVIQRVGLRTVVMYRDARDQCVSRFFHVMADAAHRHHDFYVALPRRAAMDHCVDLTITEALPWMRGWLAIGEASPQRFFLLPYGALHADPAGTLQRVLEFYGLRVGRETVERIVQRVRSRTRFNLASNLRRRAGTARKGAVGDWRIYLMPEQARRIEAACADLPALLEQPQPARAAPPATAHEVRG